MPKTPMHQSADDTWLALEVALDKLERVESERDELRALVNRQSAHWAYQSRCRAGDTKELTRFRALARGYMDERDELRAELAEWRAHDASIDRQNSFAEACRNIAHGSDGVSER